MTTNNAVESGLSGTTGTGSFAGSVSPSFTTPSIDAATATSLAFSPTTGGITGTTAADNAASGKVGEVISSVIASGSSISLTSSGSAFNVTSITLSAGDWDVWGNVNTTVAASISSLKVWTSTSSATLPDLSLFNQITIANAGAHGIQAPTLRYNVSGSTTVFLSVEATYGTGTPTACGGIYARRRR